MDLLLIRLNSGHQVIQQEALVQLKDSRISVEQDEFLDLIPDNYVGPKLITLIIQRLNNPPILIAKLKEKMHKNEHPGYLNLVFKILQVTNESVKVDILVDIYKIFPKRLGQLLQLAFDESFVDLIYCQVFVQRLLDDQQFAENVKLAVLAMIKASTSIKMHELLIESLEKQNHHFGDLSQAIAMDAIYYFHLNGYVEKKRYGDLLASRTIQVWMYDQVVEEYSVKRLKLLLEDSHDAGFNQIVLILSSIILLDIPFHNLVLDLLYLCAQKPNIKVSYALLPCLNGILDARSTCRPVWLKILDLVRKVETTGNQTAAQSYDSDHITEIHNPLYGSIVKVANCSFYTFGMIDLLSGIPQLKSIIFAATVFESPTSRAYEILEYFNEHITRFRKSDALKFLSFFQFMLKQSDLKLHHYILVNCIPNLGKVNDPFIATACLKTSIALLKPLKTSTMVEWVGLEAITEIHKLQPRIWSQIKLYIAIWANRFKGSLGGGIRKTDEIIHQEHLLEIAVARKVLYFCVLGPTTMGSDLLPIIVSLLKCSLVQDFGQTRDLSMEGTDLCLQALLACIKGGLSAPHTAWTVILKNYYHSLNSNSYPIILARFCEFFGILATTTIQEVEQEVVLRSEILLDYLVPLLSHDDELVKQAAYDALILFPLEEIEKVVVNPVEFVYQAIQEGTFEVYKAFLVGKVSQECRNMPRSVFKGLSVEVGGTKGKPSKSQTFASITHIHQDNVRDTFDYSRLNPEKSFLRSCFDAFKSANDETTFKCFLDLFSEVKDILPPVDWSFIMESPWIERHEKEIFEFASQQCDGRGSVSMVIVFLELWRKLIKISTLVDIFVSDLGLGKLLELAGLLDLESYPIITLTVFESKWEQLLNTIQETKDHLVCQRAIELTNLIKPGEYFESVSNTTYKLLCQVQPIVSSEFDYFWTLFLGETIHCSRFHQDKLLQSLTEYSEKELVLFQSICSHRPEVQSTIVERLYQTALDQRNWQQLPFIVLNGIQLLTNNIDEKVDMLIKLFHVCLLADINEVPSVVDYCWNFLFNLAFYVVRFDLFDVVFDESLDWAALNSLARTSFYEALSAGAKDTRWKLLHSKLLAASPKVANTLMAKDLSKLKQF